jgi:hypothetical protein
VARLIRQQKQRQALAKLRAICEPYLTRTRI